MYVVMYDSIDLDQIPADAQAVAGYVNGSWPTYNEVVKRWPKAHHISISLDPMFTADILDIENGAATPGEFPDWFSRMVKLGRWRPGTYSTLSNLTVVRSLMAQARLPLQGMRQWAADWTYVPHIPEGCGACQWTNKALQRNLDESLCDVSFFPGKPTPKIHLPKVRLPPKPSKKTTVAATTGAVATGVATILNAEGIHLTPAEASAGAALLTAIAGYLTSDVSK